MMIMPARVRVAAAAMAAATMAAATLRPIVTEISSSMNK